MHITILGGYGNAGTEIIRLAGKFTDHELTISGRSREKAESTASRLSAEIGRPIESTRCDVSSEHDLAQAASSCDLLLVASSTIEHTGSIAKTCLVSGTNYMDIGLSTHGKWEVLRSFEHQILDAGLVFITDGGFHPGLPGILIRYAAQNLPDIDSAHVAGSFALDWQKRTFSSSTETEFASEIRDTELALWKDGAWAEGYRHSREFEFSEPIGRLRCIPMLMQEMRDVVSELPSLRNAGFFISGFGPIVDYVVMPICMAGMSMGHTMQSLSGRLFMWGLKRFASSPEMAVLRLEASAPSSIGSDQLVLSVSHNDPYVLTAAPVVSCLRQLDAGPARPGLHTQAGFVDADQTLRDLLEMGITIETAD